MVSHTANSKTDNHLFTKVGVVLVHLSDLMAKYYISETCMRTCIYR